MGDEIIFVAHCCYPVHIVFITLDIDKTMILNFIYLALIIIFSVVLLLIVARTVKSIVIEYSNMNLHLHDNQMKKAEREIQVKKRTTELAYVSPDARGTLPLPRHLLEDVDMTNWIKEQYVRLFMAPGQSGMVSGQSNPAPYIDMQMPDLYTLWQNKQLPQHGKFLIGYNIADNKPVEVTFADLSSTLIGGQSGSGKSTFVRLILLQIILQGAKIAIIDPHANAGEDALSASFYMLQDKLWFPIAVSPEEQLKAIATVEKEVKDRVNGLKSNSQEIVIVIDETNGLLDNPNLRIPLSGLLDLIANQARKSKVYALCIGQNFHSRTIDTTIRNSFVSVFSTWSRKATAQLLSGDSDFANYVEDLKPIGQVAWYKRGQIMLLNFPNVTENHVASIISASRIDNKTIDAPYNIIPKATVPVMEVKSYRPKPISEEIILGDNIDPIKLEKIKQGIKQQKSATEIICDAWGVEKGGDAFMKASKEYRKYLAALIS